MIGSYTDIEKIDEKSVLEKIQELERKLEQRRQAGIELFNTRLGTLNSRFLKELPEAKDKDRFHLRYLKEVHKILQEFKEKYES